MTVEETLESWVAYCRAHGMHEKGLGFLLLLDFVGGKMSAKFYRQHAAEAVEVINGIDRHKIGAAEVIEDMTAIVGRYVDAS